LWLCGKIEGKMPNHTRRYRRTPVTLVVRGIPVPRAGTVPTKPLEADEPHWPEAITLGRIETGLVQADRAQRETEALLRRCRDRLRRGDRAALVELLDMNPAFIAVGWVREEFGRLAASGLLARKRGRPRGWSLRHPLAVVGLVSYVIEAGLAKNPEQAFGKCEEFGVLAYEAAKRAYYQARQDARFRPILMEFPEYAEEVDAVEAERSRRHLLGPGGEVTATWHHPRFGTVRATFRGE
jgi:hypothetical protein